MTYVDLIESAIPPDSILEVSLLCGPAAGLWSVICRDEANHIESGIVVDLDGTIGRMRQRELAIQADAQASDTLAVSLEFLDELDSLQHRLPNERHTTGNFFQNVSEPVLLEVIR